MHSSRSIRARKDAEAQADGTDIWKAEVLSTTVQTEDTFPPSAVLVRVPQPQCLAGCSTVASQGSGKDEYDTAVSEEVDSDCDVAVLRSQLADVDKLENHSHSSSSSSFAYPSLDTSSLAIDPRFSSMIDAALKVPVIHRRKLIMGIFAQLISCKPKQVQQLAQWRDSIVNESCK
jgi:hypothetical protein